jgi:hypothetical protein
VPAEFVSLADVLRRPAVSHLAPPRAAESGTPPGCDVEPRAVAVEDPPDRAHSGDEELVATVRDARLFRARLADAFDDAAARLLRELAASVLARELRTAPCELDALVARVRTRIPVARVRVAPADVARISGVPVTGDPALAAGDAVVEVAGGALDLRLGVRVAAVLEACR